jgi:hypothetical protein
MALLVLVVAVKPVAAGTTGAYLEQLRRDLENAWTTYSLDKQKPMRDESVKDAVASFNKEIKSLSGPPTQTLDGAIAVYLARLKSIPAILRAPRAAAEQSQYVAACGVAFTRECETAADSGDNRSPQECFEWLVRALTTLRNSAFPAAQRGLAAQGINAAFARILGASRSEGGENSLEQFERNLQVAKTAFPVSSAELQKANQDLYQMLETAARNIKQRASR